MNTRRLLTLTLVAIPAMAIAADSVVMKPGRWIETAVPTSIMVGGKAQPVGPDQSKTKSICLSAAEAADPRSYFAVAVKTKACTPPMGGVADGKIELASSCAKDPAAADSEARAIKINGTYGAETYAAKAVMTTSFGNAPVELKLDIAGHFDGVCKGDEDPRSEAAK